MKISVCIPVYNFDVRALVCDLKKEIQKNSVDAEIILIDDSSDQNFRNINSEVQNVADQFILLEENIGRSRIRNLFLSYVKGDYLLFLDCDVKIDSEYFLKSYLDELNQNSGIEVIYGNFKIDPAYSKTLRNRYSDEREIFSGIRTSNFSVFKTVNFLIKKETFKKFRFNEKLTHYGYEDHVFARKMEFNHVKFIALYNPVIHFDDTPNSIFLKKTETAIESLFQLSKDAENEIYIRDSKVYAAAKKLKKMGMRRLFLIVYKAFETKIVRNLLSENPKMRYFDLYKLEILLKKMK